MVAIGLWVLALAAGGGASSPVIEPQVPVCEVREMDPRRGPPRQTFCQNARGEWVRRPDIHPDSVATTATAARTEDLLPDGWRGRVVYSGTHEGFVQGRAPEMRSLSVDEALRALRGGERRSYGGRLTMELTFEGRMVSGSVSGTGGILSSRLTGTRDGSRCRLFVDDAAVIEAECTREGFVGNSRSHQGGPDTMVMRIVAETTSIIDAAEEERQRAEAAAVARVQREQQDTSYDPRNPQAGLHGYGNMTLAQLLGSGSAAMRAGHWRHARWLFEEGVARGDTQSMAFLAYTYDSAVIGNEGFKDDVLLQYWCERAYSRAIQETSDDNLMAVHNFCRPQVLVRVMTRRDQARNRRAIEAARIKLQQDIGAVTAENEAWGRFIASFVGPTSSPLFDCLKVAESQSEFGACYEEHP